MAGRYRLERQLVDVTHVALWRGHDEVLDRPVAVRLVADAHPRADQVLQAARSTACVDDRRIARVLDADSGADHVYVVTAWAPGTDLSTLLAEGPLEPAEALTLVGEVADTVAYAHACGVPHLALDPTNVVVGTGSDVTLLGLAVDDVLWGGTAHEVPPRTDARGLGALLYATLTARWPWPGGDLHGLPAAPYVGARLCTPRQVRAAIPSGVDQVCRRALGEDVGDGPIDSPEDMAQAVRALIEGRATRRWRPAAWLGRGARPVAGS